MDRIIRDLRRELERNGLTADIMKTANGHLVAHLPDGTTVPLGSCHRGSPTNWRNAVATIRRVARERKPK